LKKKKKKKKKMVTYQGSEDGQTAGDYANTYTYLSEGYNGYNA